MILGPSFERVKTFAEMMAKGNVSVPKHLRNNLGDCMAITIQALGWNMNPFAVAQKTHMTQGGALGYEAQLVSAVLVSSRAVKNEPNYTPIGDWSKILGKVEERVGKARDDGTPGGKYYVATYTKKDEEGLGVIVRATLSGESQPRELTVMMTQAFPRFSTQWATDPFQQLCYLAVRKWGRLHSPGAILGVYTRDEIEGGGSQDFNGTTVDASTGEITGGQQQAPVKPEPAVYTEEQFTKNLASWTTVIQSGRKTPDEIIAMAETRGVLLTEAQKTTVKAVAKSNATDVEAKPVKAAEPAAQPAAEAVTYAFVAEKLTKAESVDALNLAADLIKSVASQDHRNELSALYDSRSATFK
jgi:RecT family